MESRKRKRLVLDSSRKREIVKYAEFHSKCSQQDIANHFSVLWDYDVKRRTVGDILSQKDKWNTDDNERPFKMRKLLMKLDYSFVCYLTNLFLPMTKSRDAIKSKTVALCSNADGSEKLKPLVIGKSENPRCFKSFNHKLYVDYKANKKAWMNSVVFADWIKANYRRFHLQHIIDLIDSDKSPALALSDAIRDVKRAWDNVTPTTILHCWQHTEIIPRDPTSTTTTTVEAAPNTTDKVTPLLSSLKSFKLSLA